MEPQWTTLEESTSISQVGEPSSSKRAPQKRLPAAGKTLVNGEWFVLTPPSRAYIDLPLQQSSMLSIRIPRLSLRKHTSSGSEPSRDATIILLTSSTFFCTLGASAAALRATAGDNLMCTSQRDKLQAMTSVCRSSHVPIRLALNEICSVSFFQKADGRCVQTGGAHLGKATCQ